MLEPLDSEWKDRLRPVLQMYADRTAGAFLEEKTHSLVWHYRTVEPELAEARLLELRDALSAQLSSLGLFVVEANKAIEVKPPNVSKGRAAHHFMHDGTPAFVLAAGDDRTDEELFDAAPDTAWTIRVGGGPTKAHLSVDSYADVIDLLDRLARVSES